MSTTLLPDAPSIATSEPPPGWPEETRQLALHGRRSRELARARRGLRALADEAGQGTVEYVGLLLLMATVLAALVVGAKGLGGEEQIGKKVVTQIGNSIDKAGGSGGK